MLVAISDLHFSDGSSGPRNIPAEAFGIWVDEVLRLAVKNHANELVFLYSGDIFDLLHTEYWFYPKPRQSLSPNRKEECFSSEDRPWGSAAFTSDGMLTGNCLMRAREILDRSLEECKDQLALLRLDFTQLSRKFKQENPEKLISIQAAHDRLVDSDVGISHVYIPGNHDRLVLLDRELWKTAAEALNASPDWTPPLAYRNDTYKLIARHGHEGDIWNFEAFSKQQDVSRIPMSDYRLCPIGDPITTELIARLPYATYQALRKDHDEDLCKTVYDNLRLIVDVRPLEAVLRWAFTERHKITQLQDPAVCERIMPVFEGVIRRTMHDFMSLPFVNNWVAKHDRFGIDEADYLQVIHQLIKLMPLRRAMRLTLGLYWLRAAWVKLKTIFTRKRNDEDECLQGAQREPLIMDGKMRYCIYGHTHRFAHVSLECDDNHNEVVYLNTGTWRMQVTETTSKKGFVTVKQMTYLIFYNHHEDPIRGGGSKGVSYEAWTGLMLKKLRR